jgi:hypothetical protein
VSDLRGEKLSEAFVADVLRDVLAIGEHPSFAALRPRDAEGNAGYELVLSEEFKLSTGDLALRLDAALSTNPHYALARRLGQLSPVSVVTVAADAHLESLRAYRGRVGDAKPRVLLDLELPQA